MGRLTFDGLFCDIAMCKETPGGTFCENGSCSQRKVWERLKEYEDMEEQGRLVALPCKVGTKVWVVFDNGTGKHLYETRVQGISVSVSGEDVILNFGGYPVQYAWGREVGKTVFLTREEAERALKGGGTT